MYNIKFENISIEFAALKFAFMLLKADVLFVTYISRFEVLALLCFVSKLFSDCRSQKRKKLK